MAGHQARSLMVEYDVQGSFSEHPTPAPAREENQCIACYFPPSVRVVASRYYLASVANLCCEVAPNGSSKTWVFLRCCVRALGSNS